MKRLLLGVFGVLALSLSACASDYVARTRPVRQAYEAYRYDEAVQLLERDAQKSRKIDELLYLLDRGMILHAAGKWQESIQALRAADQLVAQLDVISVSEEAATLIANERERAYRGEDFERLMISTLQAINYARLGRDEDALVEVRRVNERMRRMIVEEKKPYQQLAIARYLSGALYEDQGDLDNAFIDYLEAQKLQPELGHLGEPLVRLAKKTGREDELRRLKALYPGANEGSLAPGEGEVLVVFEVGRAPVKEADELRQHSRLGEPELLTIPKFKARPSTAGHGVVAAAGVRATGVQITDLDQVARVHLDDRIGRMIAKSLASTAVKAGLAAGAGTLARDARVGMLTFTLLSLLNNPDLRSWLSLPSQFQLARIRVPAGQHAVELQCGHRTSSHPVQVRAKRISLVVERCY